MDIWPIRYLGTTLVALALLVVTTAPLPGQDGDTGGAPLIKNPRQLTFEGRRAGEGYFGPDGRRMVLQSEREAGNPFFQIYVLDLDSGDTERISPGHGKTTCAWLHPNEDRVLFASTHDDPEARQKQKDELTLRAEGKERRYSWDYDDHYELYEYDAATGEMRNLTNTLGYDAEASWSPDGEWIAFASNRAAHEGQLSEEEQELFDRDPSYFMDIYRMRSDGSELQRLTDVPGYDGGPFFSPDGSRICWRRFSENGALAEIMTMNADGSDQRQMTRLGAMSWAPFYHPSGEYLIFTTNKHGFGNFELYLVDTEGRSPPVRVTDEDGFDGLASFSPDGKTISWTCNRTPNKKGQIFVGGWDHEAARRRLGIADRPSVDATVSSEASEAAARESAQRTTRQFAASDLLRHVDYLCREELEGRRTGTQGERLATAYVAAYFDSLGLQPAGDNGSWFQLFDFTSGVDLGDDNQLTANGTRLSVDTDWRPLAFSATGTVDAAPIVFAGYGIVAPEEDGEPEYDSYVHLDVADKWVLVLRYMPEDISPERRQQLARFSSLRFKAMVARDRGARGLIVVSGPRSGVKKQLVPLQFDGSLAGSSLPVISVSDAAAAAWLASDGRSLKELQTRLDGGEPQMGFALPDVKLSANIDVRKVNQMGRNVLGRLVVGDEPSKDFVLVCAHIDHLGRGSGASSLARDDEEQQIHFGADDNASGVAAMLEIAQYLAAEAKSGNADLKRDVVFAAWSGEELGLLGSNHYAKNLASDDKSSTTKGSHDLHDTIVACLNLDMVGRLDKKLVLQGIGSSSVWPQEIERRNVPVGLPLVLQNDSYVPTDASTFFTHGVPSLSAFTGSHSEYHTPRDTPDKLNYEGAAQTARLMGLIARSIASREEAPDFIPQARAESNRPRARMRAYLGTIPDYAESDVSGVVLSGVSNDGPAAKAGVRGGDIIVELAGRKIENIYDYTYAIEALKIDEPVKMAVQRDGQRVEMQIVPGSRD